MTFRQAILSVLTVVVLLFSAGPALISSIQEQQITDRLELHQTDLLLQASELKRVVEDDPWVPVQVALVGKEPGETALKAYQETRDSARDALDRLNAKIETLEMEIATATSQTDTSKIDTSKIDTPQTENNLDAPPTRSPSNQRINQQLDQQKQQLQLTQSNAREQTRLMSQLNINLGILQAYQGDIIAARQTWSEISSPTLTWPLASTLLNLWSDKPNLTDDPEPQIRQQLSGWFRDRTLTRLYHLQQNSEALVTLQNEEQAIAQQTVKKLVLLSAGPVLGCITGIGLIIFLVVQWIIKGQEAILAEGNAKKWETPWNWDITWQVVIVGFFVVGQFVIPLFFQIFKGGIVQLGSMAGLVDGRMTAISTLMVYGLMSAGTLAVLYASIQKYQPFEKGWFRINILEKWWLWGLSGYMVAVPLVIGVSVVNQSIWQGRGGSNPLLQTVLEEGDSFALGVFFFTAAIAAPVFEEILFRGFILPSLTRYMSTWGAIALSSFIFAAAHLSVSEILPLMILGMVLGFVYTRSKNLLAPMMVHSLWNSATMVGLFILGSNII